MSDHRQLPDYASADINIQWKGTDVCLDFHCSCQRDKQAYSAHFDGYFADHLECSECGARYVLPQGFTLRAVNETAWARDAGWEKPELSQENP